MQQQPRQRLQMVEIGVAGMADIRTLMNRWQAVLAQAPGQGAPAMVMKTYRQVVVRVEDRRPGEEVFLTFLAPRTVMALFLADLKAWGLDLSLEPPVPDFIFTGRLKPRHLQ